MTEHPVLGDLSVDAGRERVEIVEALANEDALAEQVLIDVGHRPRVDVERSVAGEHPREAGRRRIGRNLGSRLRNPFMALSFLGLEVIPSLKLTDRGLVDVDRFRLVPLFVAD